MSTITAAWQKCPKCNGSGKALNFQPTGCHWFDMGVTLPTITMSTQGEFKINDPTKEACPVCNGKMIISVLNGKPSVDEKV